MKSKVFTVTAVLLKTSLILTVLLVASTVASHAAELELSGTIELPECHSIGWVRTNTQPANQRTWDWELDDVQWRRAVQQKGEGKKEDCTFDLWVPDGIEYVKGVVVISGHGSGQTLCRHPKLRKIASELRLAIFIARGKPILIEAGTPSYDNPRIYVLYSTIVGHNVLEVVNGAAKKAPAPIIVHRLDAGGGEVTVDGTAGYPVLKQWQRKVSWSADRLDVVDEVVFPKGKPEVPLVRWHLGTQEEVKIEGAGSKVTVRWADAEMTLDSSLPLVVASELLRDNTVTLGVKAGPDYLHRCVVVRLAQPCSAWTLKTGVMERR